MNVSAPACPFCDSRNIELVSAWGGQLITSQLRCRHCNTHFEAIRDDFESVEGLDALTPRAAGPPDPAP